MQKVLAFDVYGTLIDTQGVVMQLTEMVGQPAVAFAKTWREKQLEYSFRRGLMQNYQPFSVCTAQALDYTCRVFNILLTDQQKQQLLEGYKTLPAFADAASALTALKRDGHRLFAFSNGAYDAVEQLLTSAHIRDLFDGVISVDDLKSFKPNPGVYSHFLRETASTSDRAWLISGNPFDVIGAVSFGMSAAWVKRTPEAVFDPWGIEPTLTVSGLDELSPRLSG